MKLVLDTNVYVAASFGGHAAQLLQAWSKQQFQIVMSRAMREEHEIILNRHPKTNAEMHRSWISLWDDSNHTCILQNDPIIEMEWCKDLSDNKFIAAALAGQAHYLLTADKMLLTLVRIRTVQILQVKRFMEEHFAFSGE
jgi:putative PIN family toxin of toxin-antitoxin system